MSEQIYCKTIRYFSAFMNEGGGEVVVCEEADLPTTYYVVP
jgi:hypothetical protein